MILLVCLVLQAALLCSNLNLLDLWTDELSLEIVIRPIPEVLRIAAADVHPPLYYLLQHYWLQLPLGMDRLAQMRLLSAIFVLLTTIVLDRTWLRQVSASTRNWCLILWTLSPCIVLYGRMGRSYSLQVLTVVLTLWWARQMMEKLSARRIAWFCAGTLATLYVHYVPGIALAAAVGIALLRARQWKTAVVAGVVVATGYVPWLSPMLHSVQGWTRTGREYLLTGSRPMELAVKAGYTAASFVLGESVPDIVLVAGIILIPVAIWLAWSGAARARQPILVLAVTAAISFLGVARWVSYPFTPARLLFLYPFLVILVAAGIEVRLRVGQVAGAVLVLVSLTGLWNYFHKANYLNKGYAMPFGEIAAVIRSGPPAESTLVLVDTRNTDFPALGWYLGRSYGLELIGTAGDPERISQRAADPRLQTIWMFRNLHDISADSGNTAIENHLASTWHASRRYYQPFSPLQRAIARAVGVADPPLYLCELVEFRR